MKSLEWIIENWETLTTMSILGLISIYVLILYGIWLFIASAVKKGVRDALSETPIKNVPYPYQTSQAVKEGILQAMKELDIIEFKYYDENGREVRFNKNFKDDFDFMK